MRRFEEASGGHDGSVEPAPAAGDQVPGTALPSVQRQLPHGATAVPRPLDREPGLVGAPQIRATVPEIWDQLGGGWGKVYDSQLKETVFDLPVS